MAKRSATSQITKDNGGGDDSGDEVEESMPKAKEVEPRKIRALPARKSATPTPAGTPEVSSAPKPAFGGGFTFGGAAPSSTSNGFGSTPSAPTSSPFTFGGSSSSTSATSNPFAAVPANPFSSPKPSPAIPVFGAASSTPKPAAPASPFSFGGSPSSFSFGGAGAVTSAPPSPAVVPPAPSADTPWGSTPSLPDAEGEKATTLKSLSGPPPKKVASSTESMIVEAPSTPQATPAMIAASDSPFSKAFGGVGNGSPFKSSPLSTAPTFPPSSSSTTSSTAPADPVPAPFAFKASSSSAPTSLPFSPKPAETAPKPAESAPLAKDNKALVDYYRNLRGLNLSLLSLQESLVTKDPFVDLSKTLEDLVKGYRSKREELDKKKVELGITLEQEKPAEKAPVKETVAAPPKPPVFASGAGGGGFSFGGAKLDAPASTSAAPFSTFPSTSSGASPSGGFSFGGSVPSTAAAKPASTGGFSFGAPSKPTATGSMTPTETSTGSSQEKVTGTPRKTAAGAFMTSTLPEAASSSKPDDASKPAASTSSNPFSFLSTSPSSSSTTPAAPAASFSFTPFGSSTTATTSAPPAPPPALKSTPSFQRLPGGAPNFSFGSSGSTPKKSISTSSFSFGSAPTTTAADPTPAATSEDADADAPAPTIPSDPTLMESGVGEEGEETAWEQKAALSRFKEGKWEKIGTGLVKIKFGGEDGKDKKGRILARVEGSGVLLLNVKIHSDIKPAIQGQGAKAVSVTLAVVEKGKPSTILVRVKDAAGAERLCAVLKERASA